ncbi:LOW QUALITY PROTEIN: hypothetical protein PHMEG_00020417 [Phytophthora megakarya]|uniref:Uncharacterized protein n=1 Tax=Phytophthora megakarya TaxID=4795 RepID=A0A225VQZ4_9STRA|nr:LOW QUALITY PROTEIN: hypothetical protein PHMEG_00020417 [Phytophthora megakarya]
MTSAIDERNFRANVQSNDAPGCTLNDLCVIVEHLITWSNVATGLKSVHDAALLAMMWDTFGRTIDTCFAWKHQLTLSASGELFFLHISQVKTSFKVFRYTSQRDIGNSACCMHLVYFSYRMMSHLNICSRWMRGIRFLIFQEVNLTLKKAVIYWESLQSKVGTDCQPIPKRERKRPNIPSYVTEVIRERVKALEPEMPTHCEGAAAYANAFPKLAILWISTRGAWLLESLTKAFAYIGTTSRTDQSVAKCWQVNQLRTYMYELRPLMSCSIDSQLGSLGSSWRCETTYISTFLDPLILA